MAYPTRASSTCACKPALVRGRTGTKSLMMSSRESNYCMHFLQVVVCRESCSVDM